jgi:tetraacyldisaccharide 4'-kinase
VIALRPLSVLYAAVLSAKNAMYDRAALRPKKLRWPVVSVGNLTAGGSGKTPFVIALVEEFKKRGILCDVLSRGYGRTTSGVRVVDPKGSAEEFGDEPLLIAQRTGVPVIVGESRYAAGLRSESIDQAERIHILDDGFQHRKLARDVDIVLLSAVDLKDKLLPEGRLREPLAGLQRADFMAGSESLEMKGKPQIVFRREIEVSNSLVRPIAFCGIARPQRFFDDLKREGRETAFNVSFGDHHQYKPSDIDKLLRWRDQHNADGFLTTEKDLVRLGQLAERLAQLRAVRLSIQFEDPDRVIASVLSTIAARRGRS